MSVDSGAPVTVDLYRSSTLNQQAVWTIGTLANTTHKVVISWTGLKNAASSFTTINIDAVDVFGVLIPAV